MVTQAQSRRGEEHGEIAGTILLSTIITILLSRVADTQFLIRVSVNDVWGAIAIGFVAGLTGVRYLRRWFEQERLTQAPGQSAKLGAADQGTETKVASGQGEKAQSADATAASQGQQEAVGGNKNTH